MELPADNKVKMVKNVTIITLMRHVAGRFYSSMTLKMKGMK